MNKKDDVIKNPARRLTQAPTVKREKYQPEYVKMGLEPPEPAPVNNTDFRYAFNKRKEFVTSSGGRKNTPVEPPRVAVVTKAGQQEVPRQVQNVNSGFNHEHTWRPTAQYYDEETLPPDALNEEWEEKTNQQLDEEAEIASSGSIDYDEIEFPQAAPGPLPTKTEERVKFVKPAERAVKQENKQYHHLLDLAENQYCIAVEGNIVYISEDLEQVENMVEYILFDQESPLGDVSIENIAVFRRLSLKAGVVVKQ